MKLEKASILGLGKGNLGCVCVFGWGEGILLPVSLPGPLELLPYEPAAGKMLAWFLCLKVTRN